MNIVSIAATNRQEEKVVLSADSKFAEIVKVFNIEPSALARNIAIIKLISIA